MERPNYPYRFFKDFLSSFNRWFCKGDQAELKGLELAYSFVLNRKEHILREINKQPISRCEFRGYLQNKEHTSENLEFYYWYKDYKERFKLLPEHQQAKSSPPDQN
ncbi:hypothetical protein EDC96DRAFT_569366 [Choanephora cucurbitarum]|nr:hypothetical protein EDC96DRAFT_569366 [Choanephora cucurbitarum]